MGRQSLNGNYETLLIKDSEHLRTLPSPKRLFHRLPPTASKSPPSPPSNAVPMGKAGDHDISRARCSPPFPLVFGSTAPHPLCLTPQPSLPPTLPLWVRQVTRVTYRELNGNKQKWQAH